MNRQGNLKSNNHEIKENVSINLIILIELFMLNAFSIQNFIDKILRLKDIPNSYIKKNIPVEQHTEYTYIAEI